MGKCLWREVGKRREERKDGVKRERGLEWREGKWNGERERSRGSEKEKEDRRGMQGERREGGSKREGWRREEERKEGRSSTS